MHHMKFQDQQYTDLLPQIRDDDGPSRVQLSQSQQSPLCKMYISKETQTTDSIFSTLHATSSGIMQQAQIPPISLNDIQKQPYFHLDPSFPNIPSQNKLPARNVNIIQVKQEALLVRSRSLKGHRFQTHNLGWHFRRETRKVLQILSDSKMVGEESQIKIQQFKERRGRFQDYNNLFDDELIRQECLFFYSSKQLVGNILKSGRIGFTIKLMMIKYLEKIRRMIFKKSSQWKN